MALTAEVISAWPHYMSDSEFQIGVEVILNDDDTEYRHVDALEQKRSTFFATARKTEDPEAVAVQLLRRAQGWIDAYKNEKNARKHAKYEAMRNAVATGLNLTE